MRSEVQVLLDPPNPFGALAQLGERLICIQEVSGSIPLGSTIYPLVPIGLPGLDGDMKIGAITMVYRDYWALAQWYAHYARHLGGQNLFIVAHGADPRIATLCPAANIITIPRDTMRGFDRRRGRMLNSFQDALGYSYDWVIRTDADELICIDPSLHTSFEAFFEKQDARALFALGMNVVEVDGDPELEPNDRALSKRRVAVLSGHYSKAFAVHDSISLMRHGVEVKPKLVDGFTYHLAEGAYLAHLKYANLKALEDANRHRIEVGSAGEKGVPGTAWSKADKAASKFFARVAAAPDAVWDDAVTQARTELKDNPSRDRETGIIKTRWLKTPHRIQLPDWFKSC